MSFTLSIKNEFLSENIKVLGVVAKVLISNMNKIHSCFSSNENFFTVKLNLDKFYDEWDDIASEILENQKRYFNSLLNRTIDLTEGIKTKYGDHSNKLKDILDSVILELGNNKRDKPVSHASSQNAQFINECLQRAEQLSIGFINNSPFNKPPNLMGKITASANSYPLLRSIPDESANFPQTNYLIELNVINGSFLIHPLSHLFALEIIFLHEFLAHVHAFPHESRYFSEGVMRFLPSQYYRIKAPYKHGVIYSFDRVNKRYFRISNDPLPYSGFDFSSNLCDRFRNVDNFFKLIRLSAFEAIKIKKISNSEDYGDYILSIFKELDRVFYQGAIPKIEQAIQSSNDPEILLSLLRKL